MGFLFKLLKVCFRYKIQNVVFLQEMPALRLFGRKWLAASDDLVFPCLFEFLIRILWLSLLVCGSRTYWRITNDCEKDGLSIRIYVVSTIALICINLVLCLLLVNRSAQGSITETSKRRYVGPLLVIK